MSCSPPSAEHARLSCPMNDLTDACLEEIFKRLPPYERLLVSEICRRWHGISRKAWLDISKIDLKPIVGRHLGAIVGQCPNLQSLFAVEKSFDFKDLSCLVRHANLTLISFYDCEFNLKPNATNIEQSIFSDSLESNTSWTTLILHGARFLVPRIAAESDGTSIGPPRTFNVPILPTSLTHLQLSGLFLHEGLLSGSSLSLDGLERLVNLECFILLSIPEPAGLSALASELVSSAFAEHRVFEQIVALKNLKELCVGPALWLNADSTLVELTSSLPKLEVLFLTHVHEDDIAEDLAEVITSNSVLRVLVLSGSFWIDEPIELPTRKRFPHGFGSDPLPLLHVFVGKQASEKIRFTKSTSDAAIIHPTNQPMPEFLQREDIAPIFKGVWLAEMIKEAAKHGGKLWNYEIHDTASYVQHI